jgi:hypothetical protein
MSLERRGRVLRKRKRFTVARKKGKCWKKKRRHLSGNRRGEDGEGG